MTETSIYQFVRDKLITHGVEKTKGGSLILSDQTFFLLFVKLERAVRDSSFDAVQSAALKIENHMISMGKRQLMGFTYLYLRFSNFTPKRTELDEHLPDGKIRKCKVFEIDVTDEQMLIGLWAHVKYDQIGERYLRVAYTESQTVLNGN